MHHLTAGHGPDTNRELHVTSARERLSVRSILSWMFTVAVLAGVVYLWPATLGGSTRLIVVSGHSMEPTYDFGDIVVARGSGDAAVGDVVVFAVPDGVGEGILVIHRVIDIDDAGFVVTQGDNRDQPDEWQLTQDDIVGTPLAHLPKLGYVVWYLRQWWVIAVLAGLLTILLLWPSTTVLDDDEAGDDDDEHEDHDAVADVEQLEQEIAQWDPRDFDPVAMQEADAWLAEQLGDVLVR